MEMLQKEPGKLNTYVSNRIQKIREGGFKVFYTKTDENPTDFIKEFIGLRWKWYVIKTVSIQEDKKFKGYNQKFKDTLLPYEIYKNCHKIF